ncbi:terpenoid synthase [Macrolepiota fuliginosa MF-IS2]|uniref:Terpene synthase n=1 Tax=Macrolepiota fuliginosa MF-IS2 TaxID=1400762 RepID=A0A9P5XIS3_9AGAR|nr:terpenoid synthase [Macrolepiota fuliginosa MF-IS2]
MASTASTTSPKSFILPDLVSHCDFKLKISRHRKQVTVETKQWLFQGDNVVGAKREAYHGLNAGLLTAMTYPDAACPQLRVCNDFLTFLFHLDNLSDDMDNRGTRSVADVVLNSLYHPYSSHFPVRIGRMTRHLFKRIIPTASPGTQRRFIETMDFFFQSVTQQAQDRAAGVIPDLDSYIALRRDTSGCKPCWALIEFANNLKIPDEVMDHPVIRALGEATNDLVTWSNDIFSYNVEQSKGDTHNMIPVVMYQNGLDLQTAVDFVGDMCKQSIDRFKAEREKLPSWGPEIDRQVNMYANGLADWIVGSLHWSFESTRYFGTKGRKIKTSRFVELLPLRPEAVTRARAISVISRPAPPPVAIPSASAPSSSPSTPTESEPVTPIDVDADIPPSKAVASDDPIPSPPLLTLDTTPDVTVSPSTNISTRVLDRIQTSSLPNSTIQDPVPTSGGDAQLVSPDILSPAIGPLANQRIAKNGPLQPFGLYSLTLWVFYTLIYQPTMTLLRLFIDKDVHAHPFCHYEYM